MTGDGNRAYSA